MQQEDANGHPRFGNRDSLLERVRHLSHSHSRSRSGGLQVEE
jgi:hypothetical protein